MERKVWRGEMRPDETRRKNRRGAGTVRRGDEKKCRVEMRRRKKERKGERREEVGEEGNRRERGRK